MQLKIIANGEPCGTRIVNEQGGDLASLATGLTISHDAGEIPVITIRAGLIPFEVDGKARLVDPTGREIRKIEFADGEVVVFEPTEKADLADAATSVNFGSRGVYKVR